MTGKELILYILQNDLENEEVISENGFLLFMDEKEAAAKFNVGIGTIETWYQLGMIKGFEFGDSIVFLSNTEDPRKDEV